MALLLLIITPLVAALASLGVRRTIVRFEIIASLAAVVESVAAIFLPRPSIRSGISGKR